MKHDDKLTYIEQVSKLLGKSKLTLEGWWFDRDPMNGAIFLRNDDLPCYLYCSPAWAIENGTGTFKDDGTLDLDFEISDESGDCHIYSDTHPPMNVRLTWSDASSDMTTIATRLLLELSNVVKSYNLS